MKALLIIAHGCRIKAADDEVCQLAKRLRENSGPAFDWVTSAFLELSNPQVDSAIADLIEAGATEIAVFPYFLVAGTHVANDIPRIIAEAKETYPDIHFETLPHLGALKGIDTLVLDNIHGSTRLPN